MYCKTMIEKIVCMFSGVESIVASYCIDLSGTPCSPKEVWGSNPVVDIHVFLSTLLFKPSFLHIRMYCKTMKKNLLMNCHFKKEKGNNIIVSD